MSNHITTSTEVARLKSAQGAEREAARLNADAFPGQRFTVETIDAQAFAVVLIDGQTTDSRPKLTKTRKPSFTAADFHALAGSRSFPKRRGLYRTFA